MAVETGWIALLRAMSLRLIHVSTFFVGYAQQVSVAVVGSWIALVISGRWRTEKGWIGRTGCTGGAA